MSDVDFGDVIGGFQRAHLAKQSQQIVSLLQQQQAESNRVARLPKCPACASPVELEARICRQCRSELVVTPRLSAGVADGHHIMLLSRAGGVLASLTDRVRAAQRSTEDASTRCLKVVVNSAFLLYYLVSSSPCRSLILSTPNVVSPPKEWRGITRVAVFLCVLAWAYERAMTTLNELYPSVLYNELLLRNFWYGFFAAIAVPIMFVRPIVIIINKLRSRNWERKIGWINQQSAQDPLFKTTPIPPVGTLHNNVNKFHSEYHQHTQKSRALASDYSKLQTLANGLEIKLPNPFSAIHTGPLEALGNGLAANPKAWQVVLLNVLTECQKLLGPSAVPQVQGGLPTQALVAKPRGLIGSIAAAIRGDLDQEYQSQDADYAAKISDLIQKSPDKLALYLRRDQQVIGPLSATKVIGSTKQGKVNPTDFVSLSASGPWLQVSASPLRAYI
jgi:hypothetical protein